MRKIRIVDRCPRRKVQGGQIRYVTCPNPDCCAPVAGRIPTGKEERILKCGNCKLEFSFTDDQIRTGLFMHDSSTNRWQRVV